MARSEVREHHYETHRLPRGAWWWARLTPDAGQTKVGTLEGAILDVLDDAGLDNEIVLRIVDHPFVVTRFISPLVSDLRAGRLGYCRMEARAVLYQIEQFRARVATPQSPQA